MTEDELEEIIVAIVARKDATEIGSPAWKLCVRQLRGLRLKYEAAHGIIEYHDEFGAYASNGPFR